MSKHSSRISKVEDALNINEEETFHVIQGFDFEGCSKYFKDEAEIERYRQWRMSTIKENYREQGLPVPIMSYCFYEKDVVAHVDEFRKLGDIKSDNPIQTISLSDVIAKKYGI